MKYITSSSLSEEELALSTGFAFVDIGALTGVSADLDFFEANALKPYSKHTYIYTYKHVQYFYTMTYKWSEKTRVTENPKL